MGFSCLPCYETVLKLRPLWPIETTELIAGVMYKSCTSHRCNPKSPIQHLPWTAFTVEVREPKPSVFESLILLSSTNVYKSLVPFWQNAVVNNCERSNAHLIFAEKYFANKWQAFQEITEIHYLDDFSFSDRNERKLSNFFFFIITSNTFNVQFYSASWFIAFPRLIML